MLDHNASGKPMITSVLCPGLATVVGQMPVARCARQMRIAWERVLGNQPWVPRSVRAADEDDSELLR